MTNSGSRRTPDLKNAAVDNCYYALTMFPYPSGYGLHVGHASVFTINDIVARYQRMKGKVVLNPIGFDSFGLPTENYAMKLGKPAYEVTAENIDTFVKQMDALQLSFDKERIFATSHQEYYKWTQRIFQELFKKGLVYRDELWVNRCPDCQTVLANDQVEEGHCERCKAAIIQKKMPQWFIKITDYADRLIEDLDVIDRPEETKTAQKKWIGKSQGAEIDFDVEGTTVTVFTTRPDTLYGVTALVLAPENQLLDDVLVDGRASVLEYRKETMSKTSVERQQNAKEKTGVNSGLQAKHPLTGEMIPVRYADYVLPDYATGSVMMVPAHDQRDFEFANKYGIPLREVIEGEKEEGSDVVRTGVVINSEQFNGMRYPESKDAIIDHIVEKNVGKRKITYKLRDRSVSRQRYWGSPIPVYYVPNENPEIPFQKRDRSVWKFREDKPIMRRDTIMALLHDPQEDKYAIISWLGLGVDNFTFVLGGMDEGESAEHAARREIAEETGYKNISLVKHLGSFQTEFRHAVKERNQHNCTEAYLFELVDNQNDGHAQEENENLEVVWMSKEEILALEQKEPLRDYFLQIASGESVEWTGDRIEKYNKRNVAKPDVCTPHLIPEQELPVVLPLDVENYKPKGKSPLEDHVSFPHYVAQDGKTYYRECDTLDTFMCSSFYFLRFPEAGNTEMLISEEIEEKILPVDFYSGGKEHTVGHLLYSRFIHKFLYDQGYLSSPEPFKKLVHQGMILGGDGRKMSKRWGNVIDPLDVIETYGSDAVRTYLMFMGPVEQDKVWNDNALKGMKKFLDRVERLLPGTSEFSDDVSTDAGVAVLSKYHETVQGMTYDLENNKLNTAVSKIMILVNTIYENASAPTEVLEGLAKFLALFAPTLGDLFREKLGHTTDVSYEKRPVADESKIVQSSINLPVQVNGKMRGNIDIAPGSDEATVMELARQQENIAKYLEGNTPKKIIYVQDRILNIIV